MQLEGPRLKGSLREFEAWCSVVRSVSEESPGEAIGECTAQLNQRPQHFRDANTMLMTRPPRRAIAVEWNRPDPRRQAEEL